MIGKQSYTMLIVILSTISVIVYHANEVILLKYMRSIPADGGLDEERTVIMYWDGFLEVFCKKYSDIYSTIASIYHLIHILGANFRYKK